MTEQDRLLQIETMLGHHERQIQDLSDIVTVQQKEIDILKARLARTQERMAVLSEDREDGGKILSAAEQALRDKPPHY